MSLCFLEAFEEKQKGNITEQEYFHHLFAHCLGIEHERDESLNIDWDLHDADPFGYSVRCWTRRMDHVKDATPFEDVFAAYRTGGVEQVKASLDRLNKEHANFVRKSLALLALQDRRSEILKLCLDQGGFPFEHYFVDAANRFQHASDDPETFKVLEESEFRKIHPRRAPYNEEDFEEPEEEEDPSEVFDEGGRLPVDW